MRLPIQSLLQYTNFYQFITVYYKYVHNQWTIRSID